MKQTSFESPEITGLKKALMAATAATPAARRLEAIC